MEENNEQGQINKKTMEALNDLRSAEDSFRLGVSFQKKGELGKAIDHYIVAVESNSGHTKASNNLVALLIKSGDHLYARHFLDTYKKKFYSKDWSHLNNILIKLERA